MLGSLKTCSISSSLNALPKYLATKIIRQQQLRLEGKHVVLRTNMRYCPHSEIIILITLNTTLTNLLHTQTDCIHNWYKIGGQKDSQFTAAVWLTSTRQTNRN